MYCPQCSTELPDDSKFCIKCRYDFTRIKTPPLRRQGQDSLDGLGTSIQPELDVDSFAVGSLFANRYEIISEGNKGGMGAVYKCKDTMLNNKIKALKVIHPRLLSSRQACSRFRQEVAISQELQHENIVRVYDIEEWQGNEYFTMEWIEGVSLREIITKRKKENRPFSIEEAYQIVSQLSEALHHAHRHTIHRDIKPENILVPEGKELRVKLTDFGIAKMLSPSQFTSTSMQMGTPYYMAPEQKVDAANVDKRADIYALGVVLFELLTLENTIGLEMPSEINKDLPSVIDTVIKKAVATKPNDRYGDVRELSEALKKVTDSFSGQVETSDKGAEEQKQKETDQKKGEEEEKDLRAKEKEEAEQKRIEEQKRLEEEQRRRTLETERTTITGTSGQQKSFSFTNKAIAVIAVLVIIIGIYAYMLKTDKSKQESSTAISSPPVDVAVSLPAPAPRPTPTVSVPVSPPRERVQSPAPVEAPAPSASVMRFHIRGLTVLDSKATLTWTRNANLAGKDLNWVDANNFVANQNSRRYGGYSDWRLPSKDELKTLIDFSRSQGISKDIQDYLDRIGFENVSSSSYWSSTTLSSKWVDDYAAWTIGMREGYESQGGTGLGPTNFVWLVRSGQ